MEPNSGKGHKSLIIKSKAKTHWNTKLYVLYSEKIKNCAYIDIIITEYIYGTIFTPDLLLKYIVSKKVRLILTKL